MRAPGWAALRGGLTRVEEQAQRGAVARHARLQLRRGGGEATVGVFTTGRHNAGAPGPPPAALRCWACCAAGCCTAGLLQPWPLLERAPTASCQVQQPHLALVVVKGVAGGVHGGNGLAARVRHRPQRNLPQVVLLVRRAGAWGPGGRAGHTPLGASCAAWRRPRPCLPASPPRHPPPQPLASQPASHQTTHPPVSQSMGMPWSSRKGQARWPALGEMREGTVSGMDESYRKPLAASTLRVSGLCSRKGALRGGRGRQGAGACTLGRRARPATQRRGGPHQPARPQLPAPCTPGPPSRWLHTLKARRT